MPAAASAASRRASTSVLPVPAAPSDEQRAARVRDDALLTPRQRGVADIAAVGHRLQASEPAPGSPAGVREWAIGASVAWPPCSGNQSAAAGPASAGTRDLLAADWLGVCRRIVAAQRAIFEEARGIEERTVYEGVGEGGDRALVIDRRCEDAVFAELEALAADGAVFRAVSEERGEVAFGDPAATARVVIDPIDGSLNARRTIPSHSLSIAVASGPTMADVEFGYVYDFGAGEEFVARRGEGATLDGEPIAAARPGARPRGRRGRGGRARAGSLPALEALGGKVYRLRVVGSIAITARLRRRRPLRRDAQPAALPLGRRRRRAADRARGRRPGRLRRPGRSAASDLGLDARYPYRRRSRTTGSARCAPRGERARGRERPRAARVVDWGLAERVGGSSPATARQALGAPGRARPRRAETSGSCATTRGSSRRRAARRRGRRPRRVDRGQHRVAPGDVAGVERRLASSLEAAAGRSVRLARTAAGAAAGVELGLASGFLAQRVLGQYDVALIGPSRPARLLFVAPNLAEAQQRLGARRGLVPALDRDPRGDPRGPVRGRALAARPHRGDGRAAPRAASCARSCATSAPLRAAARRPAAARRRVSRGRVARRPARRAAASSS